MPCVSPASSEAGLQHIYTIDVMWAKLWPMFALEESQQMDSDTLQSCQMTGHCAAQTSTPSPTPLIISLPFVTFHTSSTELVRTCLSVLMDAPCTQGPIQASSVTQSSASWCLAQVGMHRWNSVAACTCTDMYIRLFGARSVVIAVRMCSPSCDLWYGKPHHTIKWD